MIVFQRGHAVTALEDLSLIILIHCVLIANFPETAQHSEVELTRLVNTLIHLDNGKKGRKNFTKDLIVDVLLEAIRDEETKETIEAYIEAQDMPTQDINWVDAETRARSFCESVIGSAWPPIGV